MSNYGEQVCQAVDTIIQAKLKDLSFNVTETCTIVDDSLKEQGCYVVNNGSVRYTAYSQDTSYKNDDVVYVIIPNDDYGEQKIISGKKVGNATDTPFIYQSPMASLIKATPNLVTQIEPFGLVANDGEENIGTLFDFSNKINNANIIKDIARPYTRIGISARFKTLLADEVDIGEYGIEIQVFGYGEKTNSTESNSILGEDEGKLNCAKMYGDPYHFFTYTTQEAVFAIPESIKTITEIKAKFYQKANFNIPPSTEEEAFKGFGGVSPAAGSMGVNIFADSIGIYLGYDQAEFVSDSFDIYTDNSLVYNEELTDPNSRELLRTIKAQWGHIDSTGEAHIFNAFDPNRYDEKFQGFIWEFDNKYWGMKWYRETAGAPAPDQYCGAHWQVVTPYPIDSTWSRIYNYLNDLTSNQRKNLDLKVLTDAVKIPDDIGTIIINKLKSKENEIEEALVAAGYEKIAKFGPKVNIKNPFEMSFYLDLGKQEDIIRAILIEDIKKVEKKDKEDKTYTEWGLGSPITSNSIVFNNKYFVNQNITQQKANDLIIYATDGTNSNYSFYKLNGDIKDTQLSNVKRYFDLLLRNNSINGYKLKVVWTVPAADTMLIFDEEELRTLYKNNLEYLDINQDVITQKAGNENNIKYYRVWEDYRESNNTSANLQYQRMPFRIKSKYKQQWQKNTVKCAVYYPQDSVPFSASQTSIFGTGGTSGTQYSFYLTCEREVSGTSSDDLPIVYWGQNNGDWVSTRFKVTPHLRDSGSADSTTFEEITIPDNAVTWKWMDVGTATTSGILTIGNKTEDQGVYINTVNEYWNKGLDTNQIRSILIASMKWGGIDLQAYMPFSFTYDININGAEGIYQIYYDSASGLPFSTYNTPYHLLSVNEIDDEEIIWKLKKVTYSSENQKWLLKTYVASDLEAVSEAVRQEDQFYPSIDDKNVLIPSSFYVKGLYNINIEAWENSTLKWVSPLLILQNAWPSETLNSWNGKVEVNYDKGYIAAPSIVAGTKNPTTNTFTGLLMGKAQGDYEDSLEQHGLYGFQDGIQTIALTEDGRAILGGPDAGRIIIDGTQGTIQSALFEESDGKSGVSLNLKNGKFVINKEGHQQNPPGVVKTHNVIRLYQGDESDKNYLKVEGTKQRLLNVGDNNYYLQTNDYKKSNLTIDNKGNVTNDEVGSGMRIELDGATGDKSTITAYNFNLKGEDSNSYSYVKISSDPSNFLQMHYRKLSDDRTQVLENADVLKIGTNAYFLQSFGYKESTWDGDNGIPGVGMRIDLKNPSIEAYNFKLRGENNYGSFIHLSSNSNKFLQIRYRENGYNHDVLSIGKNEYLLRSFDYQKNGSNVIQGMVINLHDTRITTRHTKDNITYHTKIDGQATTSPLQIGTATSTENDVAFKVDWDGSVSISKGSIKLGLDSATNQYNFIVDNQGNVTIKKGGINLGSGKFVVNNEGTVTIKQGSIKLGLISGTTDQYNFTVDNNGIVNIIKGAINLGYDTTNKDYKFSVNDSGYLKARSGTIGGWNITSNYLDSTVTNTKKRLYLASASSTLDYWIHAANAEGTRTFSVSKDGYLYAQGVTVTGTINATGGTITGSLTVTGTLSGGTITGASISAGSISGTEITNGSKFAVDKDGNLEANGADLTNLNVTGKLTTTEGCVAKISGSLETTGDLKIGGTSTLTNMLYVNGGLELNGGWIWVKGADSHIVLVNGSEGLWIVDGGAYKDLATYIKDNAHLFTLNFGPLLGIEMSGSGTSQTGIAKQAKALTSSAGGVNQPIYFKDGKPVACDHTLAKNVPSDAKFTDTTYTAGTGISISTAHQISCTIDTDDFAPKSHSHSSYITESELNTKLADYVTKATYNAHTHAIEDPTYYTATVKATNGSEYDVIRSYGVDWDNNTGTPK